MQLEPEDLTNLRHMLGATNKFSQWGFRNYFAAAECDLDSMKRLENSGLVVRGHALDCEHYYHATELGCKVAGLNNKQVKRALGK